MIDTKLELRATYIQASDDKLVPNKSLKNWQRVCKNINVLQVSGGHLILQANPVRCAEIVVQEVNLIGVS